MTTSSVSLRPEATSSGGIQTVDRAAGGDAVARDRQRPRREARAASTLKPVEEADVSSGAGEKGSRVDIRI